MSNAVQERWGESSASKLTVGKYLPSSFEAPQIPTMDPEEARRRAKQVLDIVSFSGEVMGRAHETRMLYVRAMGEKYAAVDFLDRARELSHLSEQLQASRININEQPAAIKTALVEDIENLNRLSEKVWGRVDPERFSAMIARTRLQSIQILANPNNTDDKKAAATRLLEQLPEVDLSLATTHMYRPSEELLDHYKPLVEKKYADFLALVPTQEKLNRYELKRLFEQCIRVMAESWQLDNALTWKVEFGRTNVNVDIETRTIWIPEHYADISRLKAQKLAVHEIGGHLLRNLLGEKSGDSFVATHLPGREGDEEALLVTIESTLDGKSRESGFGYYMGVGLARDILGKDRDLETAAIIAILQDIHIVRSENNETAATMARNQMLRLTRGMPSFVINGQLHRVIYTADLKYPIGQKNAVEWLEANRHNPSALDRVVAGKFAYSDTQQSDYANELYEQKIAGHFAVPSAA